MTIIETIFTYFGIGSVIAIFGATIWANYQRRALDNYLAKTKAQTAEEFKKYNQEIADGTARVKALKETYAKQKESINKYYDERSPTAKPDGGES